MATFALLLVYFLAVARHDTLILDVSPNDTPSPRIFGLRTVGQTISVKTNGLARVDFMVGTYQQAIQADLFFELWEVGPAKKRVVSKSFSGSVLKDNLYATAVFPPIRRSKGKSFKFVVSSLSSAPENAISLWMNARDIYRDGESLFNDAPAGGDLVFKAYAKRTIIAELGRIATRYPGVLGHPFLPAMALLLFAVVQSYFFRRLLGHFFGGKGPDA